VSLLGSKGGEKIESAKNPECERTFARGVPDDRARSQASGSAAHRDHSRLTVPVRMNLDQIREAAGLGAYVELVYGRALGLP